MLRQGLNQTKEAALCVKPRVGAELLLEWLETFDDTRHAKVVVSFSTVKCSDNQIYDAKMENLLCGLFDLNSLFLFFDTFHQLFSIGILTGHDVADTEVSKHDGRYRQQVVHLATHKWLVVANSIPVFIVLHEEDVCNVKLPCFMFAAELGGLAENFFDHGVVSLVPIKFCLHHEDRNILVQSLIVLLKS